MNNIILTLLSIHRIGRKSVDYFITSMKEVTKNEKDIVDIFIDIKIIDILHKSFPKN